MHHFFLLLIVFSQSSDLPSSSFGTVDLRCGAYCLYVALKSSDFSVPSYEEFEKRLGQPERAGYSMQQLCDAAKQYNAFAVPVHTDLRTLQKIQEPFVCIALLSTYHFVVLGEMDSNEVHVIDPPESYDMRRGLVEDVWTGNAVLISRTELPVLSPGRDRIWPWVIALGTTLVFFLLVAYAVRRHLWPPGVKT